jgi:predicted outer membrane repeat protein
MKNLSALLLLIASALTLSAQQLASPIYVNHSALGGNDGSSWGDAFSKLQDALAAAAEGAEIWVAQGTYTPADSAGARSASFVVDKNLRLYGGFAGTEASLAERGTPIDRSTILSGDLNGNDIDGNLTANRADNAFTVVRIMAGITNETVIDGFVIQSGQSNGPGAGSANRRGGGLHALGAPLIQNCAFAQNFALEVGGGLFFAASSSGFRLEGCQFDRNLAASGGGLHSEAPQFRIEGCSFEANRSSGASTNGGGGIHLINPGGALYYCYFVGNMAAQNGGGLFVGAASNESALELQFCVFEGNSALRGGALGFASSGGNLSYTLAQCDFSDNHASADGGGIHLSNPKGRLEHCNFSANTASQDGGGLYAAPTIDSIELSLALQDCRFEDNNARHGGGIALASLGTYFSYTLAQCDLVRNRASADGGGIHLSNPKGRLEHCNFSGNTAAQSGGGLYAAPAIDSIELSLALQDCRFEDNNARHGGGIALASLGAHFSYALAQCDLVRNRASADGGGIHLSNPKGGFQHCGFFDNTAVEQGGGLFCSTAEASTEALLELQACTFEGNSAREGGGISFLPQGDRSSFTLQDCDFLENSAAASGGGMRLSVNQQADSLNIFIAQCSFWRNTAASDGSGFVAAIRGKGTDINMRQCYFQGNTTTHASAAADFWGTGGGTGSVWVDSCVFEGNLARFSGAVEMGNGYGGGAAVDYRVSNSTFRANQAEEGGAMTLWSDGLSGADYLVDNCLFEGNIASRSGGGLMLWPQNTNFRSSIKRSRFIDNESPLGGAIASAMFLEIPLPDEASLLLENCLLAGNLSSGAIISAEKLPKLALYNCTLAANWGDAIHLAGRSGMALQNTILHNPGYTEFTALTADASVQSRGGNLLSDGSLAAWLNAADQPSTPPLLEADFHPSPASPAIDAGVAYDDMPEIDLAANPRLQGGCIDIGAFESPYDAGRECLVVGIREHAPETQSLVLYPNPAGNFLYAQLPDAGFDTFEAQLLDAQGRLLGQYRLDGHTPLPVGQLPPGLYWLWVTAEGQVYVGRFVKR